MNQSPTAPEPALLADLLRSTTEATTPTTRQSSSTETPSSPSEAPSSSFRTPTEQASARNAGIERRLTTGFELKNGLLTKGTGKTKVELRPTALIPSRCGEPDFDAYRDAFAPKLGAECVGPNRYRLGDLLLDANGACRDETECPECGSVPVVRDEASGRVVLGGEYRWTVPVEGQPGRYTACSRCVTDAEYKAGEAAHMAALAVSSRGGRR